MLSGLPFLRYAAIEWIHFTISSVYLAAHYWEDFIVMSEEKKRFVLAFKETELYRHHGGSGGSAASPPNILVGNVNVQKYFHWSHIEIHQWWMVIGHWALTTKDNVSHWKTCPIPYTSKINLLSCMTDNHKNLMVLLQFNCLFTIVILFRNLSCFVKRDYFVKKIRKCNVNVQSFIISKMQTAPHLDGELRAQESAG